MNTCKLSNITKQKLNVNCFYNKTPIQAGNEIIKIHHFFLNSVNYIRKNKVNKNISPFSLFSQSLSLVTPFKITQSTSSDLTDKISNIGNKKELDHPMQDFIKSLSLEQKNKSSTSTINQVAKNETSLSTQFSAEIIEVINENNQFRTLRIKRPKDWNFQPGQYLEIRAENSNTTRPSILAIASSINDQYIEITGRITNDPNHPNYCLNTEMGGYLTITGPLGSSFPFHLITSENSVLVLGGGSGLTALKSVMESLPEGTDVKMIYSSKTEKEILYREQIEKWKSEGHIITLTQDNAGNYAEGRITKHIMHQRLNPNPFVFICGPKDLVIDTADVLVEMGISREFIYGSLPATAKEGGPVYRADHPKMMP